MVLYEPRKGESAIMYYILDNGKLVMGWLPEKNKGRALRSSTYLVVRTPTTMVCGSGHTFWNLEMPSNSESICSRLLVTNPSIDIGRRVFFKGSNGRNSNVNNCVQFLTVVNVSLVNKTVSHPRLDLVVLNSFFESFPHSDSTDPSECVFRSNLPMIKNNSFKIGVDHALISFKEGDFFWWKMDEELYAGIVLDALDPIRMLCLVSKDAPGISGFDTPFTQRLNLLDEVTGVTIFTVNIEHHLCVFLELFSKSFLIESGLAF